MVSIIVPVFNGEKYIEKCLNSIINQTYKDTEIIVVNDGSTDKTVEIIKMIKDARIKLINQSNKGVSVARNEGLKKAKGKYILFFDADDYMEKDMVETMVSDIKNNDVQAVKCNLYFYYPNTKKKILYKESIFDGNNKVVSNEELLDKVISGEVMAFSPNIMIEKTEKKVRYNEKIFYMEDVIFYISILENMRKIYIENKPLFCYTQGDESATRAQSKIEKNINSLKSYNKEAKKELKRTNFYTKERAKIVDTRCTESISDLLSTIRYKSRKKAIRIFKDVFENEENTAFIQNSNKSMLAKYKLVTIYLGKNKRYNLLYLYIKFRRLCSHLKNKTIKKVEK